MDCWAALGRTEQAASKRAEIVDLRRDMVFSSFMNLANVSASRLRSRP